LSTVPAGLLRRVDVSQPWLQPYRAVIEALPADAASVAEALNAAARSAGTPALAAGPLRFVPQAELPAGEAYESFIHRSAGVPTRDTLHDLFNGLVWLRFPALKRTLNAWHAAAIAREGVGARRSPLRDTLTLFDENGALLRAPVVLTQALAARDWHGLFVTHRAAWAEAQLTLVGHALMEKLMQPRKAITAHVWLKGEAADLPALTDRPARHPLPVLGVPGWWAANEAPAFYDDCGVFRPAVTAPPAASVPFRAAPAPVSR